MALYSSCNSKQCRFDLYRNLLHFTITFTRQHRTRCQNSIPGDDDLQGFKCGR